MVKVAQSISELAVALGISKTSAWRWCRHEAWEFSRYAPWPVSAPKIEAMRRWAARTLSEDRAAGNGEPSSPERASAKQVKVQVETQMLLIELKEKAGRLHGAAECSQRRQRQLDALRAHFQNIDKAISHRLAPVDSELAKRVGPVVREELDAILAAFVAAEPLQKAERPESKG